jgi:hypothetical protein
MKRKVEDELSINPSTMKNRKRLAEMSAFEKKMHNAKKADMTNEVYHLTILRKTASWKVASAEEKIGMEEKVKDDRRFFRYNAL